MANIPIRDIPGAVVASPDPSNLIPMDNGSIMQKTTIANAVNIILPLSSQAEAEAGVDNAKRMSSLRTKQAIDAQTPAIVNAAITALNLGTMSQEESSDYTPTSGLAAVALSNNYADLSNLPTLGTMSQETASDYTKTSGLAAVALSNDYNDLDNLPTLGSAAATDASDYATSAQGALADTAVQPGNAALVPAGGTTGQVLVKNSGTNYDTGWVSSASATAVSYAPQTLTDGQKSQARENIGADDAWGFQPIGSPIALWDHLTGVEPPPTDKDYRYIELTAGLTGSGGYNEGVLTSESVSGSAPLVVATAVIDDEDSPLNGETIDLINTERQFIRAGSSGTKEDSQNLAHTHSYFQPVSASGGGGGSQLVGSGTTQTASSGGSEARPRNIGATFYMRIK